MLENKKYDHLIVPGIPGKLLKIANSANGDLVIVCLHLPLKAYVFIIDRNRFLLKKISHRSNVKVIYDGSLITTNTQSLEI